MKCCHRYLIPSLWRNKLFLDIKISVCSPTWIKIVFSSILVARNFIIEAQYVIILSMTFKIRDDNFFIFIFYMKITSRM